MSRDTGSNFAIGFFVGAIGFLGLFAIVKPEYPNRRLFE